MTHEEFDYLSIRAQIGLARAVASFDVDRAFTLAKDAVARLASYVYSNQYQKDLGGLSFVLLDPVLAKCHSYFLRVKTYHEHEIRKERERLEAYVAELEANTPGAETIYAMLCNGNSLEIEGHYLEYDEDMECICGTNPYGCDYYYGDLTLENVKGWRKAVLKGVVLGDSPPGCSDVDGCPSTNAQQDYWAAMQDSSYVESILNDLLTQGVDCE
jgi:hypothetical protein